jgi:hypothetical protein
MSNIIQKMLRVDLLLSVGLLLAFATSAPYIGEYVSFLTPFSGTGYLLIVGGAVLSIYNATKK